MSTAGNKPERGAETPVDKLRDMVTSFVDSLAVQGERAFDAFGLRVGRQWTPPLDVIESANCVQVFVDLPGIDLQQVEITLVGNMLTLKGDRSSPVLEAGDVAQRRERVSGPFTRSVPLPAEVDPDQVTAEGRNGVLLITLARAKSSAPRHIQVQVRQAGDGSVPGVG